MEKKQNYEYKKILNQEEIDELLEECEQCDKLLTKIWGESIQTMLENHMLQTQNKETIQVLNLTYKDIRNIHKKHKTKTTVQIPITLHYQEIDSDTMQTFYGNCYISDLKNVFPLNSETENEPLEECLNPWFDSVKLIKSMFNIATHFEGNIPNKCEVIVDMNNAIVIPINNYIYSKYGKYFGVYTNIKDYQGFIAINLPITLKEFRHIWHTEEENGKLFIRDFRDKQKQLHDKRYCNDILSQEEIDSLLEVVEEQENSTKTNSIENQKIGLKKACVMGILEAIEGLTSTLVQVKILDKIKTRYGLYYDVEFQLILDKHLNKEPIFYTCNFASQINSKITVQGTIAFTPSLLIILEELMLGGEYEGSLDNQKKAYKDLQAFLDNKDTLEETFEISCKTTLLYMINNMFFQKLNQTNTKIKMIETHFTKMETISSYEFMSNVTPTSMPLFISYDKCKNETQFEGMIVLDIHNVEELLTLENINTNNNDNYQNQIKKETVLNQNLNDFINKKSQEDNNKFQLIDSCIKCGNKDFEIVFKPIDYDKYYFSKKEYVKNCENYIKKENTHSYAKDCYVIKEHLVCYCKTCGYAEAIDTKDKKF